jgi:hypothetical protein
MQSHVSDKLQAAFPDKPWMWRDDWAAGYISSSNRTILAVAWGFAIVWNLVSTPLLFVFRNIPQKNYAALIALSKTGTERNFGIRKLLSVPVFRESSFSPTLRDGGNSSTSDSMAPE